MTPRVLVTGAGGFIGSRILKLASGVEAVGVVDPSSLAWHLADVRLPARGPVRLVRADLRDPDARRRLLADERPEVLIHLHASGLGAAGLDGPEHAEVNERLTLSLLDDFLRAGGKRFVFAGSCFEYGTLPDGVPVPESHPCRPETAYATSKLNATRGILAAAEAKGAEAVVLRPFHTFGPAEHPTRLVPFLLSRALDGVPAECTDGRQVRDFVYVDDVARAFLAAATRPLPSPRAIYNVSTGVATPLQAIGEKIDRILGRPAERRWGARERPPHDPPYLVGASDALRKDLGWAPETSLDQGLERTAEWIRTYGGIHLALPASIPPSPDSALPELTILIPTYNEEGNVERTHREVARVLDAAGVTFEMIFSDNCSEDRTWEFLERLAKADPRVKAIRLSRNFGYQNSLTNALAHVSGRAAVILEADLQDPPEMIPAFREKWRREGYDVVYGIRTRRPGEPLWRRAAIRVFYRFLNLISDTPLPVDAGDFRLMDRKVVDALNRMGESDRYLRGMVAWLGFRQTGIPYERRAREHGETKFSFSKYCRFALDGIMGFSAKPLEISLLGAVGMIGVGVLLAAYALVMKIRGDIVPGWTSLMIVVCFFLSFQFIILRVMGEYLGRIYREVKGRPNYVIDRKIGFPEGPPA